MLRVLPGLLAATSALAVLLVGRRRRRRAAGDVAAAILEGELELLERRAELLRRELALLEGRQAESPREVRIWMDGAFDMMHYGHANAFRKGRSLGTHLIVGVNDDASITACKGPPLMNDEERLAMVQACKWVDEVVPNVPYIMSEEYLRWAIHEYRIDYVVHGDDPCIVDGRDVYESARALGKYRTIPRTEGVSTTEIVGRMLALSTEHCRSPDQSSPDRDSPVAVVAFTRESKFLTTTSTYRIFSQGCAAPPAGARVVYVDGCWDVFHSGHADFLHEAAALGDFLLVGVHSDALVHRQRGKSFPILNLQERVLSVRARVARREAPTGADIPAGAQLAPHRSADATRPLGRRDPPAPNRNVRVAGARDRRGR